MARVDIAAGQALVFAFYIVLLVKVKKCRHFIFEFAVIVHRMYDYISIYLYDFYFEYY